MLFTPLPLSQTVTPRTPLSVTYFMDGPQWQKPYTLYSNGIGLVKELGKF